MPKTMSRSHRLALTVSFLAMLTWSAIRPTEQLTWFLEAGPVLVSAAIVYTTYHRFPWTPLTYCLLWLGAMLILIGAHYTFSAVPAFEWLKQEFDLSRNHYDRFGHFFQGFIAAFVIRELLLRTSPLKAGKWLFFLVLSVSLAKSCVYEFMEWGAAIALGNGANEFLGTQGDDWDAHKDMALALTGAVIALLILAGMHDRQLKEYGYVQR